MSDIWGVVLGTAFQHSALEAQRQAEASYYHFARQQGIPVATSNMLHIDHVPGVLSIANESEPGKVDEFKQLSNHKFHELLDKFNESARF